METLTSPVAEQRRVLEETRRLNQRLTEENLYLREELAGARGFTEIVGQSEAMLRVTGDVERLATVDANVLILGGPGTGKELVARALHERGPRRRRPFVKVDCASLPDTLLESTLFGHEKGAFIGAFTQRAGRIETADAGTLFLEELTVLPLAVQVKLLRVLEVGEFERLGSKQTHRVHLRLLASTRSNPEQEVARGNLLSDLHERLRGLTLELPPLSERREDILLLAWHFIERHHRPPDERIVNIPPDVERALLDYSWPGNVQELELVVARSLVLSRGSATLTLGATLPGGATPLPERLGPLEDVEREYILAVLKDCRGRIKGNGGAAERLGLRPSTLYSRMKKLAIERPASSK